MKCRHDGVYGVNVAIVFDAVRYVPLANISTAVAALYRIQCDKNKDSIAFFVVVEALEKQECLSPWSRLVPTTFKQSGMTRLAMSFETFPYVVDFRDDTNWTSAFSSHSVIGM